MGAKRKEQFCTFCDSVQTFRKGRIDHFLHLTIAVLSLGIWLPVWVVMVLQREFRPWVCRGCRRKRTSSPSPDC